METILNSIWLAVALATIAVWRYRWLPTRLRPRARALPELIALVCALAVLFPSVSLTDDLHPEIAIVDAASGKRNGHQAFVRASHAPSTNGNPGRHSSVAAITHPTVIIPIGTTELILLTGKFHSAAGRSDHDGRSPPSQIL